MKFFQSQKIICKISVQTNSSSVSSGGSDPCSQPLVAGPCKSLIPAFYFKSETQKCEQFNYGGCGGNDNRFSTREECQQKCETGTLGGSSGRRLSNRCNLSRPQASDAIRQVGPQIRWLFEGGQCLKITIYSFAPDDYFQSQLECESTCNNVNVGGQIQQCTNPGEEYSSCGTACPATCDQTPSDCIEVCVVGCVCKAGFVKHQGRCILKQECPSNGQLLSFSGSNPRCRLPRRPASDQIRAVGPVNRWLFESGQCIQFVHYPSGPDDYFKSESECESTCKPNANGSSTPAQQLCPTNEERTGCGKGECTCAQFKQNGQCPQHCGIPDLPMLCLCKDGYVRKSESDPTCITYDICQNLSGKLENIILF